MWRNLWTLEHATLPKLGFLGQGNHGYVSLVRTPDGLLMAKKTCFRKYADDMEKELRILQHFNSIHYNIVRSTGLIVHYETMPINVNVCSIYMEVAPHGSLKDMITKVGWYLLPEKVMGYCTLLILEGLRDLHAAGYVHCALKPENILIFPAYPHGELCELKLAGFSSAKEPNGPDPVLNSGDDVSKVRWWQGNRKYLAPEAVGPRRVISSKVDIWALGFTVLDMLGISFVDCCVPDVVCDEACDFVWKCLEMNPADRPTAEELMSHPFVRQSLGVPPVEFLPTPPCLSDGVVQGKFF